MTESTRNDGADHAPAALGVDAALDHLVHQFADPLSFLRELVQNALDAGSPEIDVTIEFRPGDTGDDGILIVHVDDYGEGMTREVIDSKLTRLFSSTKEGDYTKIGRFGIGFVSVFAIDPDAVCLDTSRGGENWRVLFHRDRSFVRIARDEPVDGTKIQVIKAFKQSEVEGFRQRARETVSYWCKHAASEIRFDGEPINQPIAFDLPVVATQEEEGTRIVAGYTTDQSAFAGFYNKGLTLHELPSGPGDKPAFFPGVAFKVSSRYLEHTLTRDNVLREENFEKAMAIVGRLVSRELPARLLDHVARTVKAGDAGAIQDAHVLLRQVLALGHEINDQDDHVLFATFGDTPVPMKELQRAARKDRLLFELKPSRLVDALVEAEHVVLRCDEKFTASELAGKLTGKAVPRAKNVFCLPAPVTDAARLQAWAPLSQALSGLLEDHDARLQSLEIGHFATPHSSVRDWVALTQPEPGAPTRLEEARVLGTSWLSRKRTLVVNVDHPVVQRLMTLATHEPELSAYLLLKLFYLRGSDRSVATDGELAHATYLRRQRRRAAAGHRGARP